MELRIEVIRLILEIIKLNSFEINNSRIMKELNDLFKNKDMLLMTWLFNKAEFIRANEIHVNKCILLAKLLLKRIEASEAINFTQISKELEYYFDRQTIRIITNWLIKKGYLPHK